MSKFESTFKLLMSKTVICEVAHPAEHAYLSITIECAEMNQYLSRLKRRIEKTRDGMGFYCVYIDVDTPEKRKQVLSDFEKITSTLEGIVEWLKLARNIDSDSLPLRAGSKLLESTLLAAIEESSSLRFQLELIAKKLKRAQTSKESKSKLRSVLDYLVNEGYLVSKASTGSIYQATAKWSLVYDQLEFIACAEGMIVMEEDASPLQQMDFF